MRIVSSVAEDFFTVDRSPDPCELKLLVLTTKLWRNITSNRVHLHNYSNKRVNSASRIAIPPFPTRITAQKPKVLAQYLLYQIRIVLGELQGCSGRGS